MATAKLETEEGPCCPICLEAFNIPRQMPCAHAFCEKCLQSHITTESNKYSKLRYVKCPVCRNSASPSVQDRPTSEWASLFPVSTILQSALSAKSKVDCLCDVCNNGDESVTAEGFCVACKQAMCGDCLKVHGKLTMSKDHAILGMEELTSNPENVLKLADGFACSDHHGEDIKYYCKDHKVPCCSMCFFHGHKICSNVIDLKEELPALLRENKPDEIIVDLKKIETHLNKFMEMNEASVNNLEAQVNSLTVQIRDVRKKINSVLDELEKIVKTEGNRIYKEEVIRKQDENHQCLSLIHAVRNSHHLLEAVHKYGSKLQKFLMAEKMKSQLYFYCSLAEEKYKKIDSLKVDVEFYPLIQSIFSISLSEVGKVATTPISKSLSLSCLQRPRKDCQLESVDVIDPKVPINNTTWYSDITFLPGDRLMLADYHNNQCILLSSSYQFITSHTLSGKPLNICVLDDLEVAVSLYNENKLQILSVIGDVIRPVRTIATKYNCSGIAAAGKGKMVVNGACGNNKGQWSLIDMRGDVKYSHQYDSVQNNDSHVACNNRETRVYVTMPCMNSLICFDMDGRKLFTYSPENLQYPIGVDVDRYDNLYVLGYLSHNIHQLSPYGAVLQVITSGVPKYPIAICIHKSKDIVIITNVSDWTKLHIYQLK